MSQVTQILSQIERGDPTASEQLLPLVYEELRQLAAAKLASEKPGQTLQATALVHEAYLRLVGPASGASPQWNSRGHFFAAAAEAMRRILVEIARQKLGPKRGGGQVRLKLDDVCELANRKASEILSVDEALAALADESPIQAELVKLRYFAGLTHQDAAKALGVSRATADRYWAYAKAFLYDALREIGDG
jgi:RNA polymerase sigma factor (TIGR02999 family)